MFLFYPEPWSAVLLLLLLRQSAHAKIERVDSVFSLKIRGNDEHCVWVPSSSSGLWRFSKRLSSLLEPGHWKERRIRTGERGWGKGGGKRDLNFDHVSSDEKCGRCSGIVIWSWMFPPINLTRAIAATLLTLSPPRSRCWHSHSRQDSVAAAGVTDKLYAFEFLEGATVRVTDAEVYRCFGLPTRLGGIR